MLNKIRQIHSKLEEMKIPNKGFRLSKKKRAITAEDYPIDFVVTWVDGSDPDWLAEKKKYEKQAGIEGNISARFRDWNLFVYWFRMVEKNAPWVHKVYLVTCGHIPSWLNTECPKLQVVKHSDYIPEEYLPTFSSIPIELNLWRIKGLSEHFVYFNDDMFLTRPVKPEDFFYNGFPKYCAATIPLKNYGEYAVFQHGLFCNLGVINKRFDIRQCMEKHPEKWFSYVLGEDLRYNIETYKNGFLSGVWFTHLLCPYRKSTFQKVWEADFERLDFTSRNRFRGPLDVMHQLFQLWAMCEGEFEPVGRNYYGTAPVNIDAIEAVLDEKNICVCVNDNEGISEEDFVRLKKLCISRLESKFNKKSSYEKENICRL